jgi:L-glyceraldehyde 3-phosphate reductase
MGTPCLIHQPSYNIFNRWVEGGLLDVLQDQGVGCIAFCPLAQGLLTDRYLAGIPDGSRATKPHGFLKRENVTPEVVERIARLNGIARNRGQTLAQFALAWVLRQPAVTSALIGASSVTQIESNVACLEGLDIDAATLAAVDAAIASSPRPA